MDINETREHYNFFYGRLLTKLIIGPLSRKERSLLFIVVTGLLRRKVHLSLSKFYHCYETHTFKHSMIFTLHRGDHGPFDTKSDEITKL